MATDKQTPLSRTTQIDGTWRMHINSSQALAKLDVDKLVSVKIGGRPTTFVRTIAAPGKPSRIFIVGRDMLFGDLNQAAGRAYCSLAGFSWADLQKRMKAISETNRAAERERRIRMLKSNAMELGFSVVEGCAK